MQHQLAVFAHAASTDSLLLQATNQPVQSNTRSAYSAGSCTTVAQQLLNSPQAAVGSDVPNWIIDMPS
jgi:hypothetical protein